MSVAASDKSRPYLPLAGVAQDGHSTPDSASATCFCGAVQLAFPPKEVQNVHICHCSDCRKISSSMFCSNFVVANSALRYVRGKEALKQFATKETPKSGMEMINWFCGTCGTLMYRTGERFPGYSILRLGTVDDFNLVEGLLRPEKEQFIKDRVAWLDEVKGDVERFEGMQIV